MNKEILYEENCYLRKRETKLYKALLDIKEYIENECSEEYCTNSRLYITDGLKRDLIFKINKALGEDNE